MVTGALSGKLVDKTVMARNSTLPNLRDTLVFCGFLLDCNQEDFSDNREWANECRWHKANIQSLLTILDEGNEDKNMVMSEKSYKKCIATFGESFVKKLFKNVMVVPYDVPAVDGQKLFADIKSKSVSLGVKVKQPGGFYNETAKQSFEDSLFRQKNGTNGYRSAKKDWPKLAVSFAELRQAKVEGELSTQFQELAGNILNGSEYDSETKAKLMASLVNEYSNLSKGGK